MQNALVITSKHGTSEKFIVCGAALKLRNHARPRKKAEIVRNLS